MADKDIINDLLSVEAWCEQLKQKCYMIRKKLEGKNSPASPKGQRSAMRSARAISQRMRGITEQSQPT